jgi:ABC-2 type transport system ATP-binding protein
MRDRSVAAAQPRILFLDEPTIGLDAVSKLALRDFLKRENEKHGVTMILTTHDMDDIESMSSRVMVIGKGKLLYDGKLEKLKAQYSPLRCIKATLDRHIDGCEIDGAESVVVDADTWTVFFDPARVSPHVMLERLAQKLPLKDVLIKEQDIDEIIASMYREMCI